MKMNLVKLSLVAAMAGALLMPANAFAAKTHSNTHVSKTTRVSHSNSGATRRTSVTRVHSGNRTAVRRNVTVHRNVNVRYGARYGGGVWYTLDLDYTRIAKILKGAGFRGWISLEMEGKEPPDVAVPKSLAVLRSAFV